MLSSSPSPSLLATVIIYMVKGVDNKIPSNRECWGILVFVYRVCILLSRKKSRWLHWFDLWNWRNKEGPPALVDLPEARSSNPKPQRWRVVAARWCRTESELQFQIYLVAEVVTSQVFIKRRDVAAMMLIPPWKMMHKDDYNNWVARALERKK
ncbi:PREDICTED: uncharacterized protein LOC109178946 [Ipomoea nil]|uniref:uncharacterized protein LOC109178946 n=1 Tax=Ipomoea nil TaxID=35883 RepID=UPI000900A6E4|nr:PREDICTED: uncharacterized protein LOC109178946 [Ipomoea nil]